MGVSITAPTPLTRKITKNTMYKIQNIVLGLVIVGLIVVGSWAKTPKEVTYDQIINAINKGSNLGALSNPDLMSNWFSFGNVRMWAWKTNMLTSGNASTTLCSFRSPDATSTIMFVSANVASTTPTIDLDIGYSQGLSSTTNSTVTPALPTATTTLLAHATIVSAPTFLNATSTIGMGTASTTFFTSSLAIAENIIFPRSYINVKVGANASTTGLIVGSCKIGFREL